MHAISSPARNRPREQMGARARQQKEGGVWGTQISGRLSEDDAFLLLLLHTNFRSILYWEENGLAVRHCSSVAGGGGGGLFIGRRFVRTWAARGKEEQNGKNDAFLTISTNWTPLFGYSTTDIVYLLEPMHIYIE